MVHETSINFLLLLFVKKHNFHLFIFKGPKLYDSADCAEPTSKIEFGN